MLAHGYTIFSGWSGADAVLKTAWRIRYWKGERMAASVQGLTEKEKETLRLMGRGHDAKSMARHLGLSVHTINERLRATRRKLSVSSSREAARLLLESEGEAPNSLGDRLLGEAAPDGDPAQDAAAIDDPRRTGRTSRVIAGALVMSLIFGIAALFMQAQPATPSASHAQASPTQTEIVRTARAFLALVDASNWEESYRATGRQFQSVNSVEAWTRASESVRATIGTIRSRELVSAEEVPAPPNGYQMVRFRSSFTSRPQAVETVTLEREGQAWKVVAIIID